MGQHQTQNVTVRQTHSRERKNIWGNINADVTVRSGDVFQRGPHMRSTFPQSEVISGNGIEAEANYEQSETEKGEWKRR